MIDRLEIGVLRSYATVVLGFLELGLGRVEAITALEELATYLGRLPVSDPEVL